MHHAVIMRRWYLTARSHAVDHAGQNLREQTAELILTDAAFGEQVSQAAACATGGRTTEHAAEQATHSAHATTHRARTVRHGLRLLLTRAANDAAEHFHQIAAINWHILPSALP